MTSKMKHINRDLFRNELRTVLDVCIGSDYAYELVNNDEFFDAVIGDVELASAWQDEGYYNNDDIRLAIGRALLWQYGIYY